MIADPTHPAEVGFCDTQGRAEGVAVAGDLVYVANGYDGLRIISVADPAHPTEVGYYDTPFEASGVTVAGDYAYVADADSGLQIISIVDPAHPSLVGSCSTPHAALSVAVAGNCAYVAASGAGLRLISISDPSRPAEVGHYATSYGLALGVAAADGYVFVTERTNGMGVYQFFGVGIDDAALAARPAAPMPTVVRGVLFLPEATGHKPQAAGLLDISGRRVLDLLPGANDVRSLAPGVYFVREDPQASSPKPQAVRKVVVTR
jgi:hypothetical protein